MTHSFCNYIFTYLIFVSPLLSIIMADDSNKHHRNNELKILNRKQREASSTTPKLIKIRINVGNDSKVFELSKLASDHLVNPTSQMRKYIKDESTPANSRFEDTRQLSEIKNLCTFYRNETTHSALLLYTEDSSQLLNGIVNEKYLIKYKPYTEVDGFVNITIESSDIAPRRIKREMKEVSQRLVDQFSGTKKFRRAAENGEKPPEKPEFYLESLVVINGQSINEMGSGQLANQNNRHKHYIVHVLSFFNVVDMLFTETRFKINIAGIIFEDEYKTFHFLDAAKDEAEKKFKFPEVKDAFIEYIPKITPTLFSRDSFDYIIYLTDYSLYDTVTNSSADGFLSYPVQGIYRSRKSKSINSYPLIITNSKLDYPSIAKATHHIFHLIGAPNYIKKFNSNTEKSLMIIRDFDSKCSDCYDWTEDYCVFVNKPRNSSDIVQLVSRNDQCWCYNYDYRYYDNTNITSNDICSSGFQCKYEDKIVLNVTSVLDGTPCDEKKVCWNKECKQKTA